MTASRKERTMEPNFEARVRDLSNQLIEEARAVLKDDPSVGYSCTMIECAVAMLLQRAKEPA